MSVAQGVRKLLRRFDYDFHRMPVFSLTLRDLEFDLPALVTKSNPVIFDVGANKGQTIEMYQRAFPKPTITSFEPNPKLTPDLVKRFPGVAIEGVGVGSAVGTLDFQVSSNTELSSFLKSSSSAENPFANTRINEVINVPIITLDDYTKRKNIGHLDILKIDTQGYDLEVLKGATGLLDRKAADVIFIEVNFIPLYDGQASFGDIQQFLKQRGYGLLTLYEIARPDRRHASWATACFSKATAATSLG